MGLALGTLCAGGSNAGYVAHMIRPLLRQPPLGSAPRWPGREPGHGGLRAELRRHRGSEPCGRAALPLTRSRLRDRVSQGEIFIALLH